MRLAAREDRPIIPFIEGDGIGPDIWVASVRVLDAAVTKAFGGKKRIVWYEFYAGEKAQKIYGEVLPEETVNAIRDHIVAIKGPLTTPVGGGLRRHRPARDDVRARGARAVLGGGLGTGGVGGALPAVTEAP